MTKLNKSQRRAVIRVIRFYRERNAYTKVTSVRAKVEKTDYGHVWVTVETRRSDCEKYSPRQVLTKENAHIQIGKRGKIIVHSAWSGTMEDKKHVQHMLAR